MKFEAARSMITHVTFTRFMSDSRLSSSFSCSSPTRSALHSTTTEAAAAAAALPLPFTSLRPSQPNRSSYRGGQYYSLEVPCFAPLSCVFMHVFTTAAFFDTKNKFGHFCFCCTADSQTYAGIHQLYNNGMLLLFSSACNVIPINLIVLI